MGGGDGEGSFGNVVGLCCDEVEQSGAPGRISGGVLEFSSKRDILHGKLGKSCCETNELFGV